jgi:hypothetical protein
LQLIDSDFCSVEAKWVESILLAKLSFWVFVPPFPLIFSSRLLKLELEGHSSPLVLLRTESPSLRSDKRSKAFT